MTDRDPHVEQAMLDLFDIIHRDGGVRTADAARALAHATFAVGHNSKPLPHDLALLSGMAAAALIDYAVMLDDERVEIVP